VVTVGARVVTGGVRVLTGDDAASPVRGEDNENADKNGVDYFPQKVYI